MGHPLGYGQPIRMHTQLMISWVFLPRSYQLSLSPQLVVRGHEPLPIWSYDVVCFILLGLVQEPQQLWVSESSGPVMPRDPICYKSFPTSGSYSLTISSFIVFSKPWQGLWYKCTISGWVLYEILFSLLWPVVSFHINYPALRSKTSPRRSEGCTNLWLEW